MSGETEEYQLTKLMVLLSRRNKTDQDEAREGFSRILQQNVRISPTFILNQINPQWLGEQSKCTTGVSDCLQPSEE